MRAARVLGVCAVAVGLVAGAAGAAVADPDGPGANDLQLEVQRLERATQADVVGAEASAMLFAPDDTAALAATDRADRRSRRSEARALFLAPLAPYREPASASGLFDAGASSDTATAARAAGDPDPGDPPATTAWPIGLAALVAVGGGLSFVAQEREVRRAE